MKFAIYSKRILAMLLICSMLILACACNGSDSDETSDQPTEESVTETENPLKEKDILISGENSFGINCKFHFLMPRILNIYIKIF